MPRQYLYIIFSLIATHCLLQSCRKEEPLCYQPTSVLGSIGFSSRSIRTVDTLIDSVIIDTTIVTVRDSPMAALKLRTLDVATGFEFFAEPLTNSVQFMLNPDSDRTRFALYYDSTSTVVDTLTFFHRSNPVFISNDCGFTHFFEVDSIQYTSDIIDSLAINKRSITFDNSNNQRVAVFYFFVD